MEFNCTWGWRSGISELQSRDTNDWNSKDQKQDHDDTWSKDSENTKIIDGRNMPSYAPKGHNQRLEA